MAAVTPLSNAVRHHAAKGAKQLRGERPSGLRRAQPRCLRPTHGFPCAIQIPLRGRSWPRPPCSLLARPAPSSRSTTWPAQSCWQASGGSPTPAGHETGIAAMTWTSQSGQVAVTALERDGDPIPMAVLAYDTSIETERNRWSDWLHLGNLIQYLGDHAIITTTSTYDPEPSTSAQAHQGRRRCSTSELLEDVVDAAAKDLAAAAVEAGWRDLVVGLEAGDDINTPIEVAWTAARVGIMPSGVARPTTLSDWDLREPSEWTTEELLEALGRATT